MSLKAKPQEPLIHEWSVCSSHELIVAELFLMSAFIFFAKISWHGGRNGLLWFRACAAWNQQQVFPWAWREIVCNTAALNDWELWSKCTCLNSANGESGENVWINLVCFELNPCRINPFYETTHVLSRILPMRIKSPLRNSLHVRYLAFLKAECICSVGI